MSTPHLRNTSGPGRKSGRIVSHPQLVRRSTRGPLDDADEPLSDPAPSSPSVTSSVVGSPKPFTGLTVNDEAAQVASGLLEPLTDHTAVSFRFLRDPRIYHQIVTEDAPSVFLESTRQPSESTPIDELLKLGHYRRAAATAAQEIVRINNPGQSLLRLYYIRLACLILISRPDIAQQEAVPLSDYLGQKTPDTRQKAQILPWELRLLLVRLQSIFGIDSGRRGILSLYNLASDLRSELKDAQANEDATATAMRKSHLSELGLRVADALVEMDELETASRHLDTLEYVDNDQLCYRQSLIRLRIGDVDGAKLQVDKINDDQLKQMLTGLLLTCSQDQDKTVDYWQTLLEQNPPNEIFANNFAVSLLYTGHIDRARDVLDDLLRRSPALLFNLSTIYELCTAVPSGAKSDLPGRIADNTTSAARGGWA